MTWADQRDLVWKDYVSSADPVPDFVLLPPIELVGPGKHRSHIVNNLASIFLDHTSYWQNSEQFIAGVFADLAHMTAAATILTQAEQDINITISRFVEAGAKRRHRVLLLGIARQWLLCTVFFTWWVIGYHHLSQLGMASSVTAVKALPVFVSDSASVLQSVAAYPSLSAMIGMIISALIISALYLLLILPLWKRWNSIEQERLFARQLTIRPEGGKLFILATVSLPIIVCFTAWTWIADVRTFLFILAYIMPAALYVFFLYSSDAPIKSLLRLNQLIIDHPQYVRSPEFLNSPEYQRWKIRQEFLRPSKDIEKMDNDRDTKVT